MEGLFAISVENVREIIPLPPLNAIHATAERAFSLLRAGQKDAALNLINNRRNRELAGLIRLFDESRRVLRDLHREMAIVLSSPHGWMCLTADAVEAVEKIEPASIESFPSLIKSQRQPSWAGLAKRTGSNETILLLSEEHLVAC
jgi:chemotaxis signal transduction protein